MLSTFATQLPFYGLLHGRCQGGGDSDRVSLDQEAVFVVCEVLPGLSRNVNGLDVFPSLRAVMDDRVLAGSYLDLRACYWASRATATQEDRLWMSPDGPQ